MALTKPRVTQLAVFCAVIGMFLATPGMVPWHVLIGGTVGIWLLAGAAFAINCLVEQKIDAMMRRTAWRPSARGEITTPQILLFSAVLGSVGAWTLYTFTNPLTMWLTIATFVGYAVIYTLLLADDAAEHRDRRRIGRDAAGARLGRGHRRGAGRRVDPRADHLRVDAAAFLGARVVSPQGLRERGLPMLPVTHGEKFTRLHILLYTVILFAVTLMPFISGMSGAVYLTSAVLLGAVFLAYAWKIHRDYSDELARKAFRYSIVYLSLLFAALLVDHYARPLLGV